MDLLLYFGEICGLMAIILTLFKRFFELADNKLAIVMDMHFWMWGVNNNSNNKICIRFTCNYQW